VVELRSGAGSIPASCRISQTVEAATFTPSTSSSPCTRRYPYPGLSRTSRSTRERTERTVRGRPGRRGRDRQACRRASMSRCQRSTVSGCTTRCRRLSTFLGSRRSSAASNARSAGVNRALSGPSCRCRTRSWWRSEDLRVLVPAAHRQQPQQREQVRHTEVGQSQQHGPSPCHSLPRHMSPPSAAAAYTIVPPVQRLQPAWMRFSAGARAVREHRGPVSPIPGTVVIYRLLC
jgi:hypothetical protein